MKKQQGFVLIFTVVILVIAAILGLYAMRSTIMQDKMTANIYNKTITTNAAEQGAAAFYSWSKGEFIKGWSTINKNGWNTVEKIPKIPDGNVNSGNNGYYWIDEDRHPSGCSSNPCWNDTLKQVTVLVTGNLVKGSGGDRAVLGETVYQIKIAAPGPFQFPDLPAALTVGGVVKTFGAPSSHASTNGGEKLAIATDDLESAVKIQIDTQKRSEHYTCNTSPSCISQANLGVWGNATQVMQLVDSIKGSNVYTYTAEQQFGGKFPSCSGIFIIKANAAISGHGGCKDGLNGILIVVGDGKGNNKLEINGGGGMSINGAVYVANIVEKDGKYVFSEDPFKSNGGGNMSINYNKNYIDAAAANVVTNLRILSWSDVL